MHVLRISSTHRFPLSVCWRCTRCPALHSAFHNQIVSLTCLSHLLRNVHTMSVFDHTCVNAHMLMCLRVWSCVSTYDCVCLPSYSNIRQRVVSFVLFVKHTSVCMDICTHTLSVCNLPFFFSWNTSVYGHAPFSTHTSVGTFSFFWNTYACLWCSSF